MLRCFLLSLARRAFTTLFKSILPWFYSIFSIDSWSWRQKNIVMCIKQISSIYSILSAWRLQSHCYFHCCFIPDPFVRSESAECLKSFLCVRYIAIRQNQSIEMRQTLSFILFFIVNLNKAIFWTSFPSKHGAFAPYARLKTHDLCFQRS